LLYTTTAVCIQVDSELYVEHLRFLSLFELKILRVLRFIHKVCRARNHSLYKYYKMHIYRLLNFDSQLNKAIKSYMQFYTCLFLTLSFFHIWQRTNSCDTL